LLVQEVRQGDTFSEMYSLLDMNLDMAMDDKDLKDMDMEDMFFYPTFGEYDIGIDLTRVIKIRGLQSNKIFSD
jgi:hypothetical protein